MWRRHSIPARTTLANAAPADVREARGADRIRGEVFTRGPRPPARTRPRARARLAMADCTRCADRRSGRSPTIGAFRVVPADDLRDDRGRPAMCDMATSSVCARQGLIDTVAPLDRGEPTTLVTLTERGRDAARESSVAAAIGRPQTFYAGVVKPSRTVTRRAGLSGLSARGRTPRRPTAPASTRVVLDYELKRDYQRFLQDAKPRARGQRRPADRNRAMRSRRGRSEHDLPVVDGHVQFPDVRIEYEQPDGRRDVEDVEVMTPHYRGAHAAAKARPGSPSSARAPARVGGSDGHRRSARLRSAAAEELLG